MLGVYHFGVVKALLEMGALPSIISGTSAGAVVAACVACRTDAELELTLSDLGEGGDLFREMGSHGPLHGSLVWKLRRLLRKEGCIYNWTEFLAHLRWFTLGLTFQEAYLKTGRTLNVTCTLLRSRGSHAPPLMLNRVTAPHVDIASAVCASTSIPGLIEPVPLLEKTRGGQYVPFHHVELLTGDAPPPSKPPSPLRDGPSPTPTDADADADAAAHAAAAAAHAAAAHAAHADADADDAGPLFRDGSLKADVPLEQLATQFGVSFTIVSQVNPHVVPFYRHPEGRPGRPSRGRERTGAWRSGFLLAAAEVYLKEDLRKWLRTLQTLRLNSDLLGIDWSHMYLQRQDGSVTLTPDFQCCVPTALDPFSNLSHPKHLEAMVRNMERNTWQASALLRTYMDVDQALGEVCAKLDVAQPEGWWGRHAEEGAKQSAHHKQSADRNGSTSTYESPVTERKARDSGGAASRPLTRRSSHRRRNR